uniref:Uncharacterized protein n=1 Tax=Chromera velia CCMP2878 TaxID=1169474 RepID=A0A0G4H9S7_9ALVE|eukprot:Cvel_6018.t1-p1 / transcript=Cvel_6018.t1 / gene=Cvel_6018 / organism=Chromera_velia_CCMP2878 / gene_product=hypothetical protein / transcript_product=hypothetical protein / location=Cvel_scaffold288:62017-67405(+) / protein_length=1078 / sequence_SO=supercontig / SO=protein_coding / is_pseudo=false
MHPLSLDSSNLRVFQRCRKWAVSCRTTTIAELKDEGDVEVTRSRLLNYDLLMRWDFPFLASLQHSLSAVSSSRFSSSLVEPVSPLFFFFLARTRFNREEFCKDFVLGTRCVLHLLCRLRIAMETVSDEPVDVCASALSAIVSHGSPPAELISALASHKDGFATGWLVVHFIKHMEAGEPLRSLDLSEFSLDAGKLRLLLSSVPVGPDFLETLKGGLHVCTGPCLLALKRFLQRATSSSPPSSLKNLNLSKCDLSDSAGGTLLHSLPPSLEYLELNENRLRSLTMEALRSAFSEGTLSKLLGLDVSNNPLGPSGVATLARGLSASERVLPLQSLKLSNTAAKAEGVKALSAPLKEGKAPSLQVLDLGGNDMRAEGVGGLAGAVGPGTLSSLRVLILKENRLAKKSGGEWEFSDLIALLSNLIQFSALQELDVSENNLLGTSDDESPAPMIGQALEGGRLWALRTLNLLNTGICQEDLTAVCTALAGGTAASLQVLKLCRVDVPPGQILASAFDSNHLSQLRDLTFEDDAGWLSEGLGVVTRCLANGKAPSLIRLKIGVIHSTDPNTHVDEILGGLAEGLREKKFSSLEDLDLEFWPDSEHDFAPTEPLCEFGRALGEGGLSSLRRLSLFWFEQLSAGVGALAEGLGSGGLVSLEELCLQVSCGGGEENGCRELGEVLSTGKVPSLQKLLLECNVNSSLQRFAEGLGLGCLSPEVGVNLILHTAYADSTYEASAAVKAVAALIRDGKVAGLRKIAFEDGDQSSDPSDQSGIVGGAAQDLGEALAHVGDWGGSQKGIEELKIDCQVFNSDCPMGLSGLFSGIASGRGSLPSLHTISIPNLLPINVSAVRPLAECITKGKFPRLRNMQFSSSEAISFGQEGMRALSVALCSPHAKSLRSLTLRSEERSDNVEARTAEAAQMAALSTAFSFGQLIGLKELSFRGELFPESVSALCVGLGSGKLRSLRSLELPRVPVGDDEGTSALCQALSAEKMPELRSLKLGSVNDAGLKKMITEWGQITPPPLEKLDLSDASVGDEGLAALASLAGAGRLPFLWELPLPKRNGDAISSNTRAMLQAFSLLA